jgi:hypothetical protein
MNCIMQIDVIKCREEGHYSYGRIEQVAEQADHSNPKGFQKHLDHVYWNRVQTDMYKHVEVTRS